MSLNCGQLKAPAGAPCIRPPTPPCPERQRLPVMTVNNTAPDKSGNVVVGIPALEDLKGKVVQLETDAQVYALLKIIAEALGMQVGAGGSWTGTVYVSLGAFATKDTIGPNDLTPELKAQLKGDQGEQGRQGDKGDQGEQGPKGDPLVVKLVQETSVPGGYNVVTFSDGTTLRIRNGAKGEDSDISGCATGVEYVSDDKKIYLKHGDTRLPGFIDVTDFVKDGMVSHVEVVDDNLVITFNTDAGKDPTYIPLTKLLAFSTDYPRQAGDATPGEENTVARGDHVHPAETEVEEDTDKLPRIADDAFPITVTIGGTVYTVASNDDALLGVTTASGGGYTLEVGGNSTCEFNADLSFNSASEQAEGLKFNGSDPEPGAWPVLQRDVKSVRVRGVAVAREQGLASKAGKPSTFSAGNLAKLDSDGNLGDSGLSAEDLFFAQYYPDGNVKSTAEFTAGIKYAAPDTENRTITVKPFSNTGDAENNNSSLAGRVVIPPFVDKDGNGYIFDDGTRYKVVGVSNGGVNKNNTKLTAIVAPATVTIIGERAFVKCTSLTSVSLPAVTTIGYSVFGGCYLLTSVSLPSATIIDSYAFNGCSRLTSVSLPSATSIGPRAFKSCIPLTSISLPSVTSIGDEAFYECTSLSSVSCPVATDIGSLSFGHCYLLTSVSLPSATTIGANAFAKCSGLAYVSLPAATSIGNNAFYGCSKLTSVDFGTTPRTSVPSLARTAFTDTPTSCKIIAPLGMYDEWVAADGWKDLYAAGYKFMGYADAADAGGAGGAADVPTSDTALLAIYYPEGNVTSLDQITTNGLEYSYNDTTTTATLSNGKSATGDIVIPWKVVKDGKEYKVTEIGENAFYDLDQGGANITSVIAPTSVSRIGNSAFYNCQALTSVSFPSVISIDGSAFYSCSELTSVSFPSVISINGSAFETCSALTSVSLPSVTSINSYAFFGCSALTSVSFPSVISIGGNAFTYCSALTCVDFGATPRDTVPTLGDEAFMFVPTSCKFIIPLGMYDEWISAGGWNGMYATGYKFVGYADASDVADAKSIANAAIETANAAIPKYGSVDAAIAGGVLTLTPFSRNAYSGSETFMVMMGGDRASLRDCVFVMTAGDTAPTISWGVTGVAQKFSPRTDAETDMEIAANTTKVFWVTEYAPNEFVVAGWQVTPGGNAP